MIASSKWTNTEPNPDIFLGQTQSGNAIRFDASATHAEGPSPMEAVLAALCACTSVDVVSILRKKRQPLASLVVSAVAEQPTESPRFFNKIRLTYAVKAEAGVRLSRKAVEDAIHLSKDKYCSVSAMLETKAEIDFVAEFEDGEPLA
jgi:putative redox protein